MNPDEYVPTEFSEVVRNYVLALTEDSDKPSAPDYEETALRRCGLLDQMGSQQCSAFICTRVDYPSVAVKLKTLGFIKKLIASEANWVVLALKTEGLASIQGASTYQCAPDPKYGDKPMKMVQKTAGDVLSLLAGLKDKQLQKAGDKGLKAAQKKRQQDYMRGIEDNDAFDMGPAIINTGRFKEGGEFGDKPAGGGGAAQGGWAAPAPAPAPAPQQQGWGASASGDMGQQWADTTGDSSSFSAAAAEPEQQQQQQPAVDLLSMGLGMPPAGAAPVPGGAAAGGGPPDSIMASAVGWVQQCTIADQSPSPPQAINALSEAAASCSEAAVVELAAHVAQVIGSATEVTVKLKALVLVEALVRNVGAGFQVAVGPGSAVEAAVQVNPLPALTTATRHSRIVKHVCAHSKRKMSERADLLVRVVRCAGSQELRVSPGSAVRGQAQDDGAGQGGTASRPAQWYGIGAP